MLCHRITAMAGSLIVVLQSNLSLGLSATASYLFSWTIKLLGINQIQILEPIVCTKGKQVNLS